MKIWLINTPEATPVDKGNVRLRHNGVLARTLVERGHEVLWWSADFFHALKRFRFGKDTTVDYQDRYRIRFLHGPGYRKNKSFARLWDHRCVAKRFLRKAKEEAKPNLIVCTFPTIDFSHTAIQYAQVNKVPSVLYIEDLWPDVFEEAAPRWMRPAVRTGFWPYRRMVQKACRGATAIAGNAPAFVQWGLEKAGRRATKWDRDFPFGYQEPDFSETAVEETDAFWKTKGLDPQDPRPIVCFFGTIGHQFDFETVLTAARRVMQKRDFLLVLCGDGDRREEFIEANREEPRIVFPGWVGAKPIWRLMQRSSLALAPYNENENFRNNLTNKPIEYLAGSLPILFSIDDGYLADLLQKHQCGLTYGGDATRLAHAIETLLDQPERRDAMAHKARALFESRFEASRVYGAIVDHLEAIVENQGSSKEG